MTGIKQTIAFVFILTTTTLLSIFCTQKQPAAELVKTRFNKELTLLQTIVNKDLFTAVQQKNKKKIKKAFIAARAQYKKIEYYVAYFFPSTSEMINGAPIDEIELGENLIEKPTGFQVMEELIYETPTTENRDELLNQVRKMQLNLKRMDRYNQQYEITDAQIFDAIRLEIFRITSLGITGFDSPAALQSLPEAAAALIGITNALNTYGANDDLDKALKTAIAQLSTAKDFNDFNRLDFITLHLQPISIKADQLRQELKINTAASGSALQDDAVSMFQKNAFNLNKFVGNYTEYITKDKTTLGKLLFNSNILSRAGNRSCASCHHEAKAFTDGLVTAKGLKGTLLRNTPTLIYAGLQRGFFYDLKAGSLEDQALDVVHHKNEMDGSLTAAAKKINQDKMYATSFAKAFNDKTGKANPWRIQHALATYIRSLSPFSSKLDKYMQGDKTQLNVQEKSGFNLFMGKGKCGTCHFAPLFNGTQAPLFQKSEAEVLGVPAHPDTANAKIDKDEGRFTLNPYPQYKYAFKTTTLRNLSKTAPYMHNGVYKTLEEVLNFYNRGGGAGIGIALDNQTLQAEPLNLSPKEIQDIIAFLNTMDDQ
ncbi:cytochrome c peroxidase [Pedobacter heparinus]|uniref:Cytochrome-c peroxidase n=1 Tax=Pedobacter heparinus (strain ATCC 13125 / DSM 2366 / CIP 104194 / JCM 7457 / NBRC 12017 / NCIMB 9290 / NRRL B-14731 / HIM 762-3) TaxID=485917 RepID=C6Y0V4_PEDHD|nr:cytochrome c peroxidase [Pedobacter heparinus]ACU04881.1 Cytochrome-c peroxidase [Pedobacter heparinus DSM 2366]